MSGIHIDEIIRSRRKTLAIEVTGDARLIVRAPLRMPKTDILDFIQKKRRWIEQKRQKVEERLMMQVPKEFVDGEKFLYLGDDYRLSIAEYDGTPLSFDGRFRLSRAHLENARSLFVEWYKTRAKEVIHNRLAHFSGLSGIDFTLFRITSAQKRWGSCNSRGNVHFSYRLIMAPLPVVDYVVVHELVHIEEKNHSSRFWQKVERILPDHRQYRRWLRDNGHLLFI
jgi:predicted metal-dependent hydrolase